MAVCSWFDPGQGDVEGTNSSSRRRVQETCGYRESNKERQKHMYRESGLAGCTKYIISSGPEVSRCKRPNDKDARLPGRRLMEGVPGGALGGAGRAGTSLGLLRAMGKGAANRGGGGGIRTLWAREGGSGGGYGRDWQKCR